MRVDQNVNDLFGSVALTQMAFDEIRLLYTVFRHNPFEGLGLLRDDPKTTEDLKFEYDRLERLKSNPPEGPCRIVFRGIRRLPDNLIPNNSNSIYRWLDNNRIQDILQRQFNRFSNELGQTTNEVEKANLDVRLKSYRKSLDDLSTTLDDFEVTFSNPPLPDDNTTKWSEIFEVLNGFTFVVRHCIALYKDEINLWFKDKLELTYIEEDETPELGLTAVQRVLFFRLLQQTEIIPKKLELISDATELRAIARLFGLNYENQIKGGSGANGKVNQLINKQERRRVTPGQVKGKMADLKAVKKLSEIMGLEEVFSLITEIENDILRRN